MSDMKEQIAGRLLTDEEWLKYYEGYDTRKARESILAAQRDVTLSHIIKVGEEGLKLTTNEYEQHTDSVGQGYWESGASAQLAADAPVVAVLKALISQYHARENTYKAQKEMFEKIGWSGLKTENEELEAQIAALEEENKRLKQADSVMCASYETACKEIAALKEQIEILKKNRLTEDEIIAINAQRNECEGCMINDQRGCHSCVTLANRGFSKLAAQQAEGKNRMTTAYCPKCLGKGWYSLDMADSGTSRVTCEVCKGMGKPRPTLEEQAIKFAADFPGYYSEQAEGEKK